MANTNFGLSQIGQIAINVKDPARATAFYRDVLGMKHLFCAGPLSFFDAGGVRLMLTLPDKPEFDHPSSILYFKVPDIQAAYQDMTSRNVLFEAKPELVARMPDHDLWIGAFRDSEGNLLALMCEAPKS